MTGSCKELGSQKEETCGTIDFESCKSIVFGDSISILISEFAEAEKCLMYWSNVM